MSTLTARAEADLVSPHAGTLVDRIVPRAEAAALERRATGLPSLTLDARELADLELIATGAASPLTGFLGAADYASVLLHLRLADGTVWPLPFTLAVEEAVGASLKPGDAAALRDPDGRLWGVIDVREIFERDPRLEARKVYRTEDPSHPGVAYLLARPRWLVAGPVTVLPLPEDLPFAAHRLTPRALRARIAERGWQRVAGFQTRNPIHRAHEHLTKLALEFADGLVIHPLVGETKNDDVPAAVGKFYGPYESQEIFDDFSADEIGVTPLKFEPTFFCHACDSLASPRTCPHDQASRLELSGTKVREILRGGGRLPRKFTRPEIAEILREHYAGLHPAPPGGRHPSGGFILWFTGLSGAGKSTLAQAVRERLSGERSVEILDGDEVRTYLSKGLGFSKEDRDTNIRRIGYVARLLARNGVAVITAAISPYAATRDEVRRLAEEEGIPFVEAYASADLDALVARDVKGLYKKALAGEVQLFTGVSDPYEPPLTPEVVVQTDRESVAESLGRVLGALEESGLLEDERRAAGAA